MSGGHTTDQRLQGILRAIGPAALAVSGGIDSLTLAVIALHAVPGSQVFHAVSPAVPLRATDRVQRFAEAHGWPLTVVDAREFRDPDYRANPVNRCFFCKRSLYAAIMARTRQPILSGTNQDDLSDFRPGLEAAQHFGVRHPYVEAGIAKPGIRALARAYGLDDISELPAEPCLASRVTSGIRIEPDQLQAIDRVEQELRARFPNTTVRCRLTPDGYMIELPAPVLAQADHQTILSLSRAVPGLDRPILGVRPYRQGSAFTRPTT